MLPLLLLTLYGLAFTLLAWKNFRLAIGLFIIGLPTYLIRFKVGPLPSTLLELMFGVLFLVWLVKHARADWSHIKEQLTINKLFFVLCSLFFLASIAGIFVSDMWYYSLGQWRAYFLEPMLVFVMLVGRVDDDKSPLGRGGHFAVPPTATPASSPTPTPPQRGMLAYCATALQPTTLTPTNLIWFLALSTLSISIFGILQRFTGWHIGNVDWIALQTHRITSFFLSPNAVGLYLGPIVPLILFLILHYRKNNHTSPPKTISPYLLISLSLISTLVILLTKSLGTFTALVLGTVLFTYLIGHKKIALIATLITIAFIAAYFLLPTSYFPQQKSQSLTNRLTLWSYSWNYLTQSPKNFLFGTGIRQFFRKIQKPHYDVKKMERLIYPHNIFLNFWTEIGLVGMCSFVVICYLLFVICYKIYQHSDKLLSASLITALTIIILHGLIDVPYFKNDLAMLFWILAAIVISSHQYYVTTDSIT